MTILHEIKPPGTRPYIRALATVQGHCWTGIRSADDGTEFLEMQEAHDRVSDEFHKRADDELAIALDLRDPRIIHTHIRASLNFRAEAYRFDALEDDRRDQARGSFGEGRGANLAASYVCESALRRDGACDHEAA